MSNISRSEYQRVVEENKKLMKDIEILTSEGLSVDKILLKEKWRKHFKSEKDIVLELIKAAKRHEENK